MYGQLRNLGKRIFNSPTIRADLESACVKIKIQPRLMVRDVAMRWNSTAELLERALQLREALNLLVISEHHNRPRSARLKRFQLSKAEWDLLDKLFPLLEVSIAICPWCFNFWCVFVGFPHRNEEDLTEWNTPCPWSYSDLRYHHAGSWWTCRRFNSPTCSLYGSHSRAYHAQQILRAYRWFNNIQDCDV